MIVEEAAEILESGLISAIGSSVQQLIMIGGTYITIVEKLHSNHLPTFFIRSQTVATWRQRLHPCQRLSL